MLGEDATSTLRLSTSVLEPSGVCRVTPSRLSRGWPAGLCCVAVGASTISIFWDGLLPFPDSSVAVASSGEAKESTTSENSPRRSMMALKPANASIYTHAILMSMCCEEP